MDMVCCRLGLRLKAGGGGGAEECARTGKACIKQHLSDVCCTACSAWLHLGDNAALAKVCLPTVSGCEDINWSEQLDVMLVDSTVFQSRQLRSRSHV